MASFSHVDDSFIQLQLKILSGWQSEDPQLKLDIRVLRHAIQQNLAQSDRIEIVNRILQRQEQLLKDALGATYEQVKRAGQDQPAIPQ